MNAKLILDNEFKDSQTNETIQVLSPWDNSQLGTLASANEAEAQWAVENAAQAFKAWRYSNLSDRIAILSKAHELLKQRVPQLAQLLKLEIAKNDADAKSEIERSLEYLELTVDAVKFLKGRSYNADMFPKYERGRKQAVYKREALGVVLAISPFNYPINLSITKIAPALIMGNTVVFKPATLGALTAFEFYKAFIEAGLPKGVLNFVTGSSSKIGDVLLTHPQVSLIAFTGSTKVGDHIRKVSNGVPLLLELGGKDNAIVTANADLDRAASEIVSGAFSYNGQRCTAQKLVLAYEAIAQELISKIQAKMQDLQMTPMIDSAAADYVQELITDAKNSGASIVIEGSRDGNILKPCLLSNINPNMRLFKEEQFGPALPIVIVENEQQAIELANRSEFGLQASVYSLDIEESHRIADQLEVGTVQINGRGDRGPDNYPFGGVKGSGMAMQGLEESLELMSRGKLIVLNLFAQKH
jgi:glyceraldehyde-3-phosphate dehydrogenase (NADP+)